MLDYWTFRWPLLGLVLSVQASPCIADVIVLANRTRQTVTAQLTPQTSGPWNISLASGEVRPIFSDERLRIGFSSGGQRKSYLLDPNCAYFFGGSANGRADLSKIGLGEDAAAPNGRTLPGSARTARNVVLPVKIVVDDEEPTRQEIWERRLRSRVDAASEILLKHCGVGFRVVAVERWDSDDQMNDFTETLNEFEREVKPGNAQVAIGFSNQYELPQGRFHMGGTKGPFHSHILLREWSKHASERERLELLVHELGHFLGATHSPEPDSVMRPLLSDRQSRRVGFQIKFDPVNTLALALVGEEVRRRRITSFGQLTAGTRQRLGQIYAAVAPTLPDDPAANKFQSLVGGGGRGAGLTLPAATKQVVGAITRIARQNGRQSPSGGKSQQGDALTELYVRAAAQAAANLPPHLANQAFLRGVGIGLDPSGALAQLPQGRSFLPSVETGAERTARAGILGEPTMRGRKDLTLHFALSAYLTAAAGPVTAEAAGLAKEVLDAQGNSGFSFADLAADRAGVRFAKGVIDNRFKLPVLAQRFTVRDFVPDIAGLPEELESADLLRDYDGTTGERFDAQVFEIDRRIGQLPPYR